MELYENAFSPFARKVRLVIEYKALACEYVDGLDAANEARLARRNPRREVPVLVDGDLVVASSSDIVAYLDERHPERPVLPADPAARAAARAWERLADTLLDAVLHGASIWTWPMLERADRPPAGLAEAASADLESVYDRLEGALGTGGFLLGELSIADLALFPHLSACAPLGFPITEERHPRTARWYERLRALPICRDDVRRAARWVGAARGGPKLERIFWRGDRVEWMLARGFHEWFFAEVRAGRVAWPIR